MISLKESDGQKIKNKKERIEYFLKQAEKEGTWKGCPLTRDPGSPKL